MEIAPESEEQKKPQWANAAGVGKTRGSPHRLWRHRLWLSATAPSQGSNPTIETEPPHFVGGASPVSANGIAAATTQIGIRFGNGGGKSLNNILTSSQLGQDSQREAPPTKCGGSGAVGRTENLFCGTSCRRPRYDCIGNVPLHPQATVSRNFPAAATAKNAGSRYCQLCNLPRDLWHHRSGFCRFGNSSSEQNRRFSAGDFTQ